MKTIFVITAIIALIFVFYCINNKVRIKTKTFLEKGFKPVRGAFGIYCYCGKQGKGKTYSVVEYLLDNKNDIAVFCNVKDIDGIEYFHFTGFKELIYLKEIIDFNSVEEDSKDWYKYIRTKFDVERSIALFRLLKDWKTNKKQLVFVYDEIFSELQKYSRLNKDVMDFLSQMRKRQIIFLTTAQEWAEIPLTFRRFCRFEIDCNMVPLIFTGILIKIFKDAENMKWSDEDQEHVAPLLETTVTHTRKRIADSYDTFLRISSVAPPVATDRNEAVSEEEQIKWTAYISELKTSEK